MRIPRLFPHFLTLDRIFASAHISVHNGKIAIAMPRKTGQSNCGYGKFLQERVDAACISGPADIQ